MSSGQSIEGLIKWARREEWRDKLAAALDRHIGPASRGAGVTIDELGEIIGGQWLSTLWGCAFEDLVSSSGGGPNIAEDYLKRRGWKESAGTRAYIQALRQSVMSLYEVSDIVVGESFMARDLVRGGGPVRVFERAATRSLAQWDRIAARVVTVLGKTQISGGVLVFRHEIASEALAMLDRVRKKARSEALKLAKSLGGETVESALAEATGVNEVLASSAFMFSNLWLNDVLGRALNPSLPVVQNSDGEPLEFLTLHFAILPSGDAPAIRSALNGVPHLRQESDTFWNWVEPKAVPRRRSKSGRTTAAKTFTTTMDDGALVLGNIELTDKSLTLSVNSEARATRGRALLEPLLAGLVRAPLVERQTVEQMLASSRAKASPKVDSGLPAAEERRIVHQSLTDHYRRTLDEPIPALGDMSPRQAVTTPKGREKVVAWLKMLENASARQGADDPMASYDFSWMWRALGLGDARR